MEKLSRRKILSKSDFELYPIWVWDETREYKIPITNVKPSWDDFDTFFIKAKFQSNNHLFNGYLVGNKTYYAFTLFIDSEIVKFNANSESLNKISLSKLFHILNCKPFSLFPIEFTSEAAFKEPGRISGTLDDFTVVSDKK